MQRIAAPEQDASSLQNVVQSATAASDVFMLGGVTYEALVGKPAFPVKSDSPSRGGRWQVPYSHHHHITSVLYLLLSCFWNRPVRSKL